MDFLTNSAQWLNRWPWLNLVLLLLAIMGIVLAIVFYARGKRLKLPVFRMRTFRLIQDKFGKIEAVKILYREQPVANLSLTQIGIWNRGNDTINSQDVAQADSLRLELATGITLLGAELESVVQPANNFAISVDLAGSKIDIRFDYMHTGEGALIKVYHTGKSNKDVLVRGTIKGAGTPKVFLPNNAFQDAFFAGFEKILPRPKTPIWGLLYFGLVFAIFIGLVPVLICINIADLTRAVFVRPPKPFAFGEAD